MIDELDLTWILYAAIAIATVIGALILTTRPARPINRQTLRRIEHIDQQEQP